MSNSHIEFQSAMTDFKIMFPDMVSHGFFVQEPQELNLIENIFCTPTIGLGCHRRNIKM